MKASNYFQLESTKNEHSYRFLMPVGVPLGEAYDAVIEIAGDLVSIINQQIENSKPKKPEEDKIVKMEE